MTTRFLTSNKIIKLSLLFTLPFFLMACGEKAPQKAPPKPAVSVYVIKSDVIGDYREFVARTEASREANIRARVKGELIKRDFREGTIVEKEQVLFEIDPAAYKASLASAKAQLASKISGEENAKRNLLRANKLINDGYISQSDFDKLTTEQSQAESAVSAARAALEQAELDLSYTVIKAPFTGRIGRVNYNIGNIIGPESDILATLTLSDPMYVNFQLEESEYTSYLQRRAMNNNKTNDTVDLSILLPNNSAYKEQGTLDFADTQVTQGMGTVEVRASFPNPKGVIVPGLFVTLVIESKTKKDMSMVPQAAVQANQQGKFVLFIDEENKVKQRPVVLGRRVNAMWVVESGLVVGDRVIIEGLQKVRPGVEIKPIEKNVDALTGTMTMLEKPDSAQNTQQAQ
ncbi:MAG: efflux RND transporter periplasmic adaptor subunit [Colwellia sp.]